MSAALYDRIGRTYAATRAEDPRIAAVIRDALGNARTVLNVGAGAGAYEPPDLDVTAVEPSATMRAQRPPGAAPCVDARAEALPFADGSFDAATAIRSDHHWADRAAGLRELRRVARRVVVFQWDPAYRDAFWLVRDHVRDFAAGLDGTFDVLRAALGGPREIPVPIPHDCRDGELRFACQASELVPRRSPSATLRERRPEAYLDPAVRANISVFRLTPPDAMEAMLASLRADLESGAWARRNADILELDELDLGYRLLVAG